MNKALRTEAADPTTPPVRLKELAKQGCAREVAGNPNTPTSLLLKLAARHFEAFLANPVLPLLLLEDPGFCAKIPASALRRLLRRTELPASFLQALARHPDPEVRDGARWHVGAPAPAEGADPVAERLATMQPSRELLALFATLDALPSWVIEPLLGATNPDLRRSLNAALASRGGPEAAALLEWVRRTGLTPPKPGRWLTPDTELSPEDFARLLRSGTLARRRAAELGTAPPEGLVRLLGDASPVVRRMALMNRNVPVEQLWRHASAGDWRTREAVARNPAAPAMLLEQLAGDARAEVRRTVARARFTPPEALVKLAGDADTAVRRGVAGHRWAPVAALERLAADPDAKIRERVAAHRFSPVAVVEPLLADVDERVRRSAIAGNITFPALLAQLRAPSDRPAWEPPAYEVSRRHDLPERLEYALYRAGRSFEDIRLLLGDWRPRPPLPYTPPPPLPPWRPRKRGGITPSSWEISRRRRTAEQTEDVALLEELAEDPDPWVRYYAARNRHTPEHVIQRLIRDPDPEIRRDLLSSSPRQQEIAALLLDDPDPGVRRHVAIYGELDAEQIRRVDEPRMTKVRRCLAWKEQAPPDLLELWSRDPDREVRERVARNPSTPPEVLRRLASDPCAAVAAALGHNQATPADAIAHAVRRVHRPEHREDLAAHAEAPVEFLVELLDDPWPETRAAVVRHPRLPLELALRGRTDPAPMVRRALCGRKGLSAELISELAREYADNPRTLAVLSCQESAPFELLSQWARHEDPYVRAAVARHPALDEATLRALAADDTREVHASLAARQPALPWLPLPPPEPPAPTPQSSLAKYPGWQPVEATEENRKRAREGDWPACRDLLGSHVLPRELIELLARNPHKMVRQQAGHLSNLPADLADELSRDPEEDVQFGVASNAALKGAALKDLLVRPKESERTYRRLKLVWGLRNQNVTPEMRRAVAEAEVARLAARERERKRVFSAEEEEPLTLLAATRVPATVFAPIIDRCSPALRLTLLQRADCPPEWRQRFLGQTLANGLRAASLFARVVALAHPDADPAELAKAAVGLRWMERLAVVRNPAISRAVLTLLADDAHRLVREEARAALAIQRFTDAGGDDGIRGGCGIAAAAPVAAGVTG